MVHASLVYVMVKLSMMYPASEATDDVFSEIYGRTIKEDEKLGVN